MTIVEDCILLHLQDGKRIPVDPQEIYLLEAEGGETLVRTRHAQPLTDVRPLGLPRQAKVIRHPFQKLNIALHGALLLGQAVNLAVPAPSKECILFSSLATAPHTASIRRRRIGFNQSFNRTGIRALRGSRPVKSNR